ncbi:hypothetical protein K2Z84_30735 [Candidatus Binatia bacterium]|nr:hypothetical protein [Candidatus Binatia bacterium]
MNDTSKPRSIVLTALALLALAATAHAQPASGLQQTPDSARYLISKDVGSERWAISFNLADNTVTGNVFKTDGSPPSFVFCKITNVTEAAVPADIQYTLDCSGADACTAAPCTPTQWTPIASGLVIGGDFLLPDETKSTYGGNVQPIFNASCALPTCHAGANPADDLNLEASVSYGNLFLIRPEPDEPYLVEPFAPEASILYQRVISTDSSERMPLFGDPLPAAQIDAIRNWILEGAAEN